ncbi:hypothetical protein HanIR_Chr09g0399641 [Helianthus annuus]|nr:hypothetical protein HanIR_Chr09g0399641 [Helianthus annuus]
MKTEKEKYQASNSLIKDLYKVTRLQNVSGTLWSLQDTMSKNCVNKIIYLIKTFNIFPYEKALIKKRKEKEKHF